MKGVVIQHDHVCESLRGTGDSSLSYVNAFALHYTSTDMGKILFTPFRSRINTESLEIG